MSANKTSEWADSTISTSDILRDIREAQEKLGPPPKKILYSSMCIVPTDRRLFPASRHRSARIRKKLIKRFGGEFFMKPIIIETSDAVIAHTSFQGRVAEFERKLR